MAIRPRPACCRLGQLPRYFRQVQKSESWAVSIVNCPCAPDCAPVVALSFTAYIGEQVPISGNVKLNIHFAVHLLLSQQLFKVD